MADILLLALVMLGIVVVIGGAIAVHASRKKRNFKEPDYKALYGMGAAFLPVGIVMAIATKNPGMLGLTVLGVIYLSMGLKNRDKWKDKPKKPKPKKPKPKKRKL